MGVDNAGDDVLVAHSRPAELRREGQGGVGWGVGGLRHLLALEDAGDDALRDDARPPARATRVKAHTRLDHASLGARLTEKTRDDARPPAAHARSSVAIPFYDTICV